MARILILRPIQLKRQHSADLLSTIGNTSATGTSPSQTGSTSPTAGQRTATPPHGNNSVNKESHLDGLDSAFIGSPLKKQRASVSGPDDENLRKRIGNPFSSSLQEATTATTADNGTQASITKEEKPAPSQPEGMDDEEL